MLLSNQNYLKRLERKMNYGSNTTNTGGEGLTLNSITSNHIIDGSIITIDISSNAITTAKIADNTLTANKLQGNSVTTSKIASNSIIGAQLQGNIIITSKIANEAVTLQKLSLSLQTTLANIETRLAALELIP
jgi:hypothetical protein